MSFNSYAQNFEDVMLWRALGHIEHGFYIDIGAQDPVVDSVSLAFHERRWQGIHVEPTPHYAALLRQQRPGDTVLQAAVGESSAILKFFEIPDTGISTADPSIAAGHRGHGFNVCEITVPSITLSSIFDSCSGKEIHWLKIDVEGFEKQVLLSWGDSPVRPWILIIESTLPLTQTDTYESWEYIVISKNYSHVYSDGLNRYFVSNIHPELKSAFLYPPNVFDDFSLNGTASAPFQKIIIERFEKKINEALNEIAEKTEFFRKETETLNRKISILNEEYVSQQKFWLLEKQSISEENIKTKEDLNALHNIQIQREQQYFAQQSAILQQARQQKLELALDHSERELALHIKHANQEIASHNELKKLNEKFILLQQEHITRENILINHTIEINKEIENILRIKIQREEEFSVQLLKIQQKSEREKHELIQSHKDEISKLSILYAERENRLQQKHQEKEDAFQTLIKERLRRENELGAMLLAAHQQGAEERMEHLRFQHEREYILQRAQLDWVKKEKLLEKEIFNLQQEFQIINRANQLLMKQHDVEISTKLKEHECALAGWNSLEAALKAEVISEKQKTIWLRESLTEVQQQLASTHASFSWRMTSPLRKLANHIGSQKIFLEPKSQLFSNNGQQVSTEVTMLPNVEFSMSHIQNPAKNLEELLSFNDKNFVYCAYQTILGSNPDPEGFSYYLSRLRKGYTKISILKQLYFSKDGKKYGSNLPGLQKAIQDEKKSKYPIIGWFFQKISGAEGHHPIERKLRIIENQSYFFNDESDRRFNELASTLAELKDLVIQQNQKISNISSVGASISIDSETNNNSQIFIQEEIRKLTPRAKNIYFKLRKAAIHDSEKAKKCVY